MKIHVPNIIKWERVAGHSVNCFVSCKLEELQKRQEKYYNFSSNVDWYGGKLYVIIQLKG